MRRIFVILPEGFSTERDINLDKVLCQAKKLFGKSYVVHYKGFYTKEADTLKNLSKWIEALKEAVKSFAVMVPTNYNPNTDVGRLIDTIKESGKKFVEYNVSYFGYEIQREVPSEQV